MKSTRNAWWKVATTFLVLLGMAGAGAPAHARFLGADPVKPDTNTGENFNRYSYANNSPYRYTDPDGRLPILIPVAIGAGIGLLTTAGDAHAPGPGDATSSMSLGEAAVSYLEAMPLGRFGAGLRLGVEASGNRPEPPALARGKRAHREEPLLPGEQREAATPSGKRMDRYNPEEAHIREIKPDNPRAVRQGAKQVEGYRQEMEAATGRPHTAEVSTYDPAKYTP
jgi:hypothetical protein